MSRRSNIRTRRFLSAPRIDLRSYRHGLRDSAFRGFSARCCFVVLLSASIAFLNLGRDLHAQDKSRTPATSIVKDLKMSQEELRVRVRALIRPTLGLIEESADRIIANTSDPLVRREAIVLKIEMTTTMLAAMLRSDPLLALADAWGYVLQVKELLSRPGVEAKYGQAANKASEALAVADAQFRDFVSGIQPGPFAESFAAAVRQWADRHPIKGALSRRPSMDSAVAKMIASSGGGGVFSALGSLEETTADVMMRMDLYTMYLPRLARWEAELAADDLTRGVDVRTLSAEFERLTGAVDRLAAVAETAPDLVERERTAVLNAVQAERLAVLDGVQKERIAILQEIEVVVQRLGDRSGAPLLEAVRKERVATLREIEAIAQRLGDRSGAPLHEAVQADLRELTKNVEEMRRRLMVEAREALEGVVDHAFLRLGQLLLLCAVLVALGLVFRGFLLRRKGR